MDAPTGTGPNGHAEVASPVLLVHGFGTSASATWRHNGWLDLLADAGRTTIAVDLLGHGEAPRPTDPESYRDLEDHVLAALPDVPVDAVGFSAGASVILWLATHHPDRFRRIVVAGVGANLFDRDPERWRAIAEAVRTGTFNDPQLRYFADLPEAGTSKGEDVVPEARAAMAAFLTRPDRRLFTPEILAGVTAPVLVVLGDRDFAGPADPLVEALPDANHQVLRGVDHFATPKDFGFINAALDFLEAQPF
jgi:pimeloyl-ACP methyl ester carboxylesterase